MRYMRYHKLLSVVIPLLLSSLWLISPTSAQKQEPSKPSIAVLQFMNKADNQWAPKGGAAAAQDVFITELVKGGKFRVVEREQLEALMKDKDLGHDLLMRDKTHPPDSWRSAPDIDPKTAVTIGKLLGVRYLLTGVVTQYGVVKEFNPANGKTEFNPTGGKGKFVATMNARLIDTSTGKSVWSGEASSEASSVQVSAGGAVGCVDDNRVFDAVMKPCIRKVVAMCCDRRSF